MMFTILFPFFLFLLWRFVFFLRNRFFDFIINRILIDQSLFSFSWTSSTDLMWARMLSNILEVTNLYTRYAFWFNIRLLIIKVLRLVENYWYAGSVDEERRDCWIPLIWQSSAWQKQLRKLFCKNRCS